MKMNHAKRSLAVLLALLMILVSVPVVTAAESEELSGNYKPGEVLVSLKSGSASNISLALQGFEIESTRLITPGSSSMKIYHVVFVEKTKEIVREAIAVLGALPFVEVAEPNYIGEYLPIGDPVIIDPTETNPSSTEAEKELVPGSILVSVQTGSPRSISGARNTVKTALADFEIESIGMLASTKTYIVFQVVLTDKSEAQVNLAVSALDEIDGVNYAKADDNEYWFCEPDDFEPGSIIVTGSVGNLLADFEIESTRLLTPGSGRSVYCIYFKEKTKEIVWKALEVLESSPQVRYAEPNYVCRADDIPDLTEDPTEPKPSSVIKGDADGDGYVSVSDATTIQRYLVGFYDLDDEQVLSADTDGDGYVSISDVTMIQRYLVGLVENW